MKNDPFTKQQLKKIYSWAENNIHDDPLAKAYLDCCLVVGSLDADELQRHIYRNGIHVPLRVIYGIHNKFIDALITYRKLIWRWMKIHGEG